MPWKPIFAPCLLVLAGAALGQEIIKLPAGTESVARPDDLFELPPGQWHFARQLWQGREPCAHDQCEAGYTTGDLVVSVEHSGEYVRIISGLRGCESTAFSEMNSGKKPSSYTRKRIARQVNTVVKGLGKTCKVKLAKVAPLDAAQLFPAPPAK